MCGNKMWSSIGGLGLLVALVSLAPAADPPAQQPIEFEGHSLRLGDYGFVALKNSQQLIDPTKPFTIEMWVRFYSDTSYCQPIGFGPVGKTDGASQTLWSIYWSQNQTSISTGFSCHQGNTNATGPQKSYVWMHLAVCGDGKTVTMYLNGKKNREDDASKCTVPKANSTPTVVLGQLTRINDPYRKPPEQDTTWQREYRVVRISSVARYAKEFTPPQTFKTDDKTVALLDFSELQANEVKDLSGNGHDGLVVGGQWTKLPGEAPAISDGPQYLQLKCGDYVEMPVDDLIYAPGINERYGIEMWIRWKVGSKGMQWLGSPKATQRVPGIFTIKAVPDKKGPQLHLEIWEESGTSTVVVPLPKEDTRWHKFSLSSLHDGSASIQIDHQVIGRIKMQGGLQKPIRVNPAVLVVGDPVASSDTGSRLDIRGLRMGSAGAEGSDSFPHDPFMRTKYTLALWDFRNAKGHDLPDLSVHERMSRVVSGTWRARSNDAEVARVTGGKSLFDELAARARQKQLEHATAKLTSTLSLHQHEVGGKPLAIAQAWLSAPRSDQVRQDRFTHELCRQGLLLAAREELSLVTRDQVLGECDEHRPAMEPTTLELLTVSTDEEVNVKLAKASAPGEPLWEGTVSYPQQGEPALLAQIEAWARSDWPAVLRKAGYPGETRERGTTAVPQEIEEQLAKMDFFHQFAAVRALHALMRTAAPSPQLEGALARGYANLGMLTEFHWNHAHKARKARGLLYAQRAAANLQRPGTLANRAYAWTLCGFHQHALADLKAAEHPKSLAWTKVLEAYCLFDVEKLGEFDDTANAELAALLRYFTFENPTSMRHTLAYGGALMQKNPFCFRALDGMFAVHTLGNLRRISEVSPYLMQAAIRTQLPQWTSLPDSVLQTLDVGPEEMVDEVDLIRQLRLVGEPMTDYDEFTWRSLAQMLEETHFVHVWNLATVMRFSLGLPAGEYLESVKPRYEKHPHRAYIEVLGGSHQEAARIVAMLGDLRTNELPAYAQAKILGNVHAHRDPLRAKLVSDPKPAMDRSYFDLVTLYHLSHTEAALELGPRLVAVSPHSPAGPNFLLEAGRTTPEVRDQYEEKFGWNPSILAQLVSRTQDKVKHLALIKRWVEVSQEHRAYVYLANHYRREGNLEQWKATLESFLETPQTGLEHAQVRVQIAEYYMKDQKWKEAEPYALEAAESYAAWAMWTAVKCYEGQGDLKSAEVWVRRIAQRYQPEAYEAWLKKHGLKPGDEIPERQDAPKKQE